MQRSTFPVWILALLFIVPVRAHEKPQTIPTVGASAVSVRVSSSKGVRLVAQTPTNLPGAPKVKVAAVMKKPAAPLTAAASISHAGMMAAAQPVVAGRLARITAYWTDEDIWTARHLSSTGVHLHEGHCAVDPKLIPYGSVVQIPGMGSYVAVDTGSAVISRQAAIGSGHTADQRKALVVDLFFENEREAQDFAAHGPSYAAVSWTKPLTAPDAPLDPKALPVVTAPPKPVYELASSPDWGDGRMPLNFRSPQL